MKRITILLCSVLLYSNTVFSQKDTVKVGLFITNLYDFNLADGSYVAEFWTWSLFKKDSISFKESQEITKSKNTSFSNFAAEKKGNLNWEQKKCIVTILQDWNLRSFPFDHQKLVINLEEAIADTTVLLYVADSVNSKISNTLDLDEWQVDSFFVKSDQVPYNTTYGNPELRGNSVYSSLRATVLLTRTDSWTTFIKLVTGLYVAFLISLMVFKIVPADSESRIGLAVGGLFAAVGNKYIVQSIIPSTTQNIMIDHIHNVTFGAILLIVIMTIYISALYFHKKEEKAAQFDKLSFWGILIAYMVLNSLIIINAI